jgi:GAF domain-containing protein
MTAFAADSLYARCVRGGEPVIFAQPDSQTLERARPGGREIMSRYASFLAVPATAGAEVAGFLAFARTAGTAAFNDGDAPTVPARRHHRLVHRRTSRNAHTLL